MKKLLITPLMALSSVTPSYAQKVNHTKKEVHKTLSTTPAPSKDSISIKKLSLLPPNSPFLKPLTYLSHVIASTSHWPQALTPISSNKDDAQFCWIEG